MTDGPGDWRVIDFLARYTEDREAGRVRPLSEYLAMHPGHEEAVAREYLALQPATELPAGDGGRRIGPYRLVEELGRGGQGAVYLAEHGGTGETVALKVLVNPLAGPDSPERFQREARIAGRLDHPGICPILDLGVDGELHYLAMPRIEGQPLSRMLEAAPGGLDPDLTLGWIEATARALDAAHRAGVIHRDVKPGNIMIRADGQPVILDFGLARDDSSESLLTRTGDVFGTPAYMSPEQLDPGGAPVSPATDLWSLAVVAYECFTGRRPFEAASREGIYDAIRHRDPTRPGHLAPGLPRGLDTVLEVALDKDPERRYASALHFAEDLARVRRGDPVHARAPGRWVRLGRFARRNPGTTTAALALLVFLVTALVYTDARRHTEATLRQTADQRSDDLRRLARHILIDLHDEVQDMPGATIANKEIVERALEFLQVLGPAQDPAVDAEIKHDLALAHLKIGDVFGNRQYANLGKPLRSLEHYRTAVGLAEALPLPGSIDLRARCLHRLGNALEQTEGVDPALAAYEQGLRLLPRDSTGDDPARRVIRGELHLAHALCIGRSDAPGNRSAEALAELEGSAAAFAAAGAEADAAPPTTICHAALLLAIADLRGRTAVEADLAAAALRAQNRLLALPTEDQARLRVRLLLASSYSLLAKVARDAADFARAEDLLRRSVRTLDMLVGLDPANELARRRLIEARRELGEEHSARGRFAEARAEFRAGLALAEDSERRFGPAWTEYYRAHCLQHLGGVHYELQEFAEALRCFEQGLQIWTRRLGADESDLSRRTQVARGELLVARALRQLDEAGKAKAALLRARGHYTALRAKDPDNKGHTRALQNIGQILGEFAFQVGDFDSARERFQEAVDLRVDSEGDAESVSATRSLAILRQGLANATYQCRRFAEAHGEMERSLELFRKNAERAPDDTVCQRQHALALLDSARLARRAVGAELSLARISAAGEISARLAAAADATPKVLLTHLYVKVFEAYLRLEGADESGARSALDEVLRTRKRAPELQMMPMYRQLLDRVRKALAR